MALRDEGNVKQKKRIALKQPLTIRRLEEQVADALSIPRSWDVRFLIGDEEDRRIR